MAGNALHLELQLQTETEPITGRLTDQQGRAIDFTGWLELITAIEAAMAGASHPAEPSG